MRKSRNERSVERTWGSSDKARGLYKAGVSSRAEEPLEGFLLQAAQLEPGKKL